MKTWLITGCSTGLGRALAAAALAHGDRAIITARNVADVADLAAQAPDRALALPLDVTDAAQVDAAVAAGTERFGGIDVLVNNAGYGYRAAVEEAPLDDVHALFETHVFGMDRLVQAVLPQMRSRGAGTIANVSSIGVHLMHAGSGHYSAAKAAIEGITGALRKEVAPHGITAFSIEPGGFRTDFAGRSLQQSAEAIDAYAETAGRRRKETDTTHGTQPGDPDGAARAIIAAVDSGRAPEVLLLGSDAVDAYRAAARARLAAVDEWEELSRSTDF